MIEKIYGLEKMNILQCQKLAEKVGFDSATFDLCGPKGKLQCVWLDAYMGMFRVRGKEGFNMVSQFQFIPDLWCENLMPSDKTTHP